MANVKISALPSDTAPTADDLVATVNDPGGTPATRQSTITNFTKAIPAVVGDAGAGGTKGLVPAPAAGDTAAGKFLKADGTFAVPSGTGLTQEQAEDIVGAMLLDGGVDFTYDDGAGTISNVIKCSFVIACSDESTVLVAANGVITFRMPHAMTLTAVRASLKTAAATGTFTVDINESGSTILSTKLTIDATEKTSTTAAAAAVISDASLADDAEITIDIDDDASGDAVGLKVTLIGTRA